MFYKPKIFKILDNLNVINNNTNVIDFQQNQYPPITTTVNLPPLPTATQHEQYRTITTHTVNKDFFTICSRVDKENCLPLSVSAPVNLLAYYQQNAKAAYKKYFFGKHSPETERKYLLCWFNDMKSILHEHGITEQHFFKPIK